MVDFESKEFYNVYDLIEIIHLLRSENGCPWDREQTHESIRRNFIEETYEACEAIDLKDSDLLREELGDVLMQVVFHAAIEEDAGGFSLDDVADGACKKLIFRHPHVFGEVSVKDSTEVLVNWDALKRKEKKQLSDADTLASVSRSLPALWRAEKVQGKAAKAGFDLPDISGALDKIEKVLREIREAIARGEGVGEEIGNLLFSAVNAARFANVDPEDALNASSDKFIRRFRNLEHEAEKLGGFKSISLYEMDRLNNEIK